jgi:protein-tyrosine kinase
VKTLSIRKFPELDYDGKEAINTLCTNLTLSGENCKRIMMTSLLDAEGKTFLSMQILRTLSELGKRAVLIDADLRRSTIDTTYRIQYTDDEKLGLAHYLTKKCEMNDIIYATDLLRAYYVPAGYVANNSLALLNAARFRQLLEQVSHLVEFIIVDAPPIGMIVDALEIAKSCDGAVLVVGYNQVHRKDLLTARCEIEKTGCEVLGTVINNVPMKHYMTNNYKKRKNYRGYDLEQ